MYSKEKREHLGITRQELVSLTGLSYSYLTKLENGERSPSKKALGILHEALTNFNKKFEMDESDKPMAFTKTVNSVLDNPNFILEAKLGKTRGKLCLHIQGEVSSETALKIVEFVQKALEYEDR